MRNGSALTRLVGSQCSLNLRPGQSTGQRGLRGQRVTRNDRLGQRLAEEIGVLRQIEHRKNLQGSKSDVVNFGRFWAQRH